MSRDWVEEWICSPTEETLDEFVQRVEANDRAMLELAKHPNPFANIGLMLQQQAGLQNQYWSALGGTISGGLNLKWWPL